MAQTTLTEMIEAARTLPPEDQRRLRQWLEEQERKEAEQQKRQEAVRQQVERFQKAMKWIQEHRNEYMGQWVVLEGDQLISHGTDARQVYEEARAAGIEAPFLERVTEEEKQPYWAGW
jgi:hypothetical protein